MYVFIPVDVMQRDYFPFQHVIDSYIFHAENAENGIRLEMKKKPLNKKLVGGQTLM
jgi:hypothetical protein